MLSYFCWEYIRIDGDCDDSNGIGAARPARTATSVKSSQTLLSTRRIVRARTMITNGTLCWAFNLEHVMTKGVATTTLSVTAILACPLARSRSLRAYVKPRIKRTRAHLGTVSSRGTRATGTGASRRTIPLRSLALRVGAQLARTYFFRAKLTRDYFYYSTTRGRQCHPPNGAHDRIASGQDEC